MRKVFDEGDAVDFRADLETALDAFESRDGFGDRGSGNAGGRSEDGGSSSVEGVVFAGEVHFEIGPRDAGAQNFPMHAAGFVAEIANAPIGGFGESVALDGAKGAADTFSHVRASVIRDDEAAAWDEIDEALEGSFDSFEVGVDVGVVELNVREDERGGKVVQKLGALVEERGVVLVTFKDEVVRGAELEARAKVFRDAANEERGLKRRIFARSDLVDPRKDARRRGFAVSSCDDEGFAVLEKLLA